MPQWAFNLDPKQRLNTHKYQLGRNLNCDENRDNDRQKDKLWELR